MTKNINIKIENERHQDLVFIQDFLSEKSGTKLSQAQTLKMLLFETSNVIRNTGDLQYRTKDELKK